MAHWFAPSQSPAAALLPIVEPASARLGSHVPRRLWHGQEFLQIHPAYGGTRPPPPADSLGPRSSTPMHPQQRRSSEHYRTARLLLRSDLPQPLHGRVRRGPWPHDRGLSRRLQPAASEHSREKMGDAYGRGSRRAFSYPLGDDSMRPCVRRRPWTSASSSPLITRPISCGRACARSLTRSCPKKHTRSSS